MERSYQASRNSWLVSGTLLLGALALFVVLFVLAALTGGATAIKLFIPAFLAGLLSFLSPCTLPVLPAYFAWTFGLSNSESPAATQQWRILGSSLAFFAGLATTMVLITFIASKMIGSVIATSIDDIARIGGILIIVLGILNFFGLGIAGPTIKRHSSATFGSAYLYGLTFALGWTACIGPILGSILTMMIASDIPSLSAGVLGLLYAFGLGLPLMIIATFFQRFGQGSNAWKWLRGKAWTIQLGNRTLMLHSTNVISGIMLIIVGILMALGTLSTLSQYQIPGIGEWANDIQYDIQRFFGVE